MGLSFEDSHGSAKKNNVEYIKLEFGKNRFRLVGQIRPRYAYWKELNNNSIPVECLSFDPVQEKFTNVETDWFKHYFPDAKCVWSYVVQVIDPKDGKLKLCGLKKKLWDQVLDAAQSLGDPTDPENGWDIIVDKKKTGTQRFNVEYSLQAIECSTKKAPIPEEFKALLDQVKPIDELVTRPTAEEQKAFIEKNWINVKEESNVDNDAIDELGHSEYDDFKKKESDITADVA
jgi:hypothetical protein